MSDEKRMVLIGYVLFAALALIVYLCAFVITEQAKQIDLIEEQRFVEERRTLNALWAYSDLTTDGNKVSEDFQVTGWNKLGKYIVVVTKDRSLEEIRQDFYHELGHEKCWRDSNDTSEQCAKEVYINGFE